MTDTPTEPTTQTGKKQQKNKNKNGNDSRQSGNAPSIRGQEGGEHSSPSVIGGAMFTTPALLALASASTAIAPARTATTTTTATTALTSQTAAVPTAAPPTMAHTTAPGPIRGQGRGRGRPRKNAITSYRAPLVNRVLVTLSPLEQYQADMKDRAPFLRESTIASYQAGHKRWQVTKH
jgi:hypothetical protein